MNQICVLPPLRIYHSPNPVMNYAAIPAPSSVAPAAPGVMYPLLLSRAWCCRDEDGVGKGKGRGGDSRLIHCAQKGRGEEKAEKLRLLGSFNSLFPPPVKVVIHCSFSLFPAQKLLSAAERRRESWAGPDWLLFPRRQARGAAALHFIRRLVSSPDPKSQPY